MDGFINLLKPIGPTSFQAVAMVKRIMGGKKAGHTGTLDPGAAGVLPVCLGKATKLASFVTDTAKMYRAEIYFGLVTDTQDIHGEVIGRRKAYISKEEVEGLLKEFQGRQEQTPPMYSAVKQKGKKLYQLARKGLEVERKPRSIEVYGIELVDYFPPDRAIIQIECSKGTYVRTLCHDIGARAGCGAVMSCLVRLRTGRFSINNAVTIEELGEHAEKGTLSSLVLPLDFPLQDMPKACVREDSLKFALNGNTLYNHNIQSDFKDFNSGQMVRLYYRQSIIAIGVCGTEGQTQCIRIRNLLTGLLKTGDINKRV